MKIRFPKPKVAEYNSLFKMVASNEGLDVKRSNKHLADSPIRQWQDAAIVQLRGGASREENLLVSGRLAHPAPSMNSRAIIRAVRQAVASMQVDHALLERLLGSAEYARGAKVSDGHYSNPKISKSATKIIEDAKPERLLYSEEVAENVALRLLGAPVKWVRTEHRIPTSAVTPITKEEVLDENIKDFYERFLLQAIPLALLGEDRRVNEEPTVPTEEPPTEEPEDGGGCDLPVEADEASDEGKEEPQEKPQEEPQAEEKVEPKDTAKTDLERVISETAKSISAEVEDNAEKTFERRQQASVDPETLVPEKTDYDPEVLEGIGVPKTFNPEADLGYLPRWTEPKFKLSSLSPIEDDGQSTRSFTGLPTSEAWKMSMLGNINVFDSTSSSGDAASLLILADLSGSTIDGQISTSFGKGNTQDVIWALSGKMLELSANSRSYGFYSSGYGSRGTGSEGATLGIVEGQKANTAPRSSQGGGGTPTAEVLAWAADKSESSDEVIVLITDGMPDHKAPAMVRRMTDNGSRVAVVVVPNTNRYGSSVEHCLSVARSFGGEMSAVCDVRNPKSIEALNEFMANLIV